jgi:hypothetical protein
MTPFIPEFNAPSALVQAMQTMPFASQNAYKILIYYIKIGHYA